MQKQEAQSKKENLPWISEFMFPLFINKNVKATHLS
jgi:hypothetical protein